jgi:hypothetical protein
MTKDNVKMMDMDEDLRDFRTQHIQDLIAVAKRYDLIVDIATSDVCIYVTDKWGGEITIA